MRPRSRRNAPEIGGQSLAWPASAEDPNAASKLDLSDFAHPGGGAILRDYVASRLNVVADVEPSAPREWCGEAVQYLREQAGDHVAGGFSFSAAAAQLVAAYVDHLEVKVSAIECAKATGASSTLLVTKFKDESGEGWTIASISSGNGETCRFGPWPRDAFATAEAFARGYALAMRKLGIDCIYAGDPE